MNKRIKIGIIGPNTSGCSDLLYQFGIALGQSIAKKIEYFLMVALVDLWRQ